MCKLSDLTINEIKIGQVVKTLTNKLGVIIGVRSEVAGHKINFDYMEKIARHNPRFSEVTILLEDGKTIHHWHSWMDSIEIVDRVLTEREMCDFDHIVGVLDKLGNSNEQSLSSTNQWYLRFSSISIPR